MEKVGITLTEREAIQKMMVYIEEERSRLWTDYKKLLDRLRELDEIEQPNEKESKSTNSFYLGDPPVNYWGGYPAYKLEGSIDMSNSDIVGVSPIDTAEEDTGIELPEDKEEPESSSQSIQDYFTENNIPLVEEEPTSIIPKEEIEALKDKDRKKNPMKTSSRRDIKVVAQFVKAILKESGVPMKTSDLITKLKEAGIDTSSPYGMLNQVRGYDPRIEQAAFGYYQYKW